MNRPFLKASDKEVSSGRRFIHSSPSVESSTAGTGTRTGGLILNNADGYQIVKRVFCLSQNMLDTFKDHMNALFSRSVCRSRLPKGRSCWKF